MRVWRCWPTIFYTFRGSANSRVPSPLDTVLTSPRCEKDSTRLIRSKVPFGSGPSRFNPPSILLPIIFFVLSLPNLPRSSAGPSAIDEEGRLRVDLDRDAKYCQSESNPNPRNDPPFHRSTRSPGHFASRLSVKRSCIRAA